MSQCGLCNRILVGGGCPIHGRAYVPGGNPTCTGAPVRVLSVPERIEHDLADAIAVMRNFSGLARDVYSFDQMEPDERDLAVKIAGLLAAERRFREGKPDE